MRIFREALLCLATGLIVFSPASADDSSLGNSVINQRFEALESENAALKSRLAALENLLAGVSRGTDPQTGQDTLQFSTMNVQVVNGTGYPTKIRPQMAWAT